VVCGVPEGRILYVDLPAPSAREGEFEGGVGLDGGVEVRPLTAGETRWIELEAPAEREAAAGGLGR
jgi:hypothetical protein